MTTILKSTASKIAHNTHLPLAGNKDLKSLQNLITAEKAVLQSLQRLSQDVSKASESLRIWGMGEGEDLSDILQSSTTLYLLFSSALSTFVQHEHTIRQSMKAVRSREEALDELKRRRKTVGSKCDAAEKKLAKTAPEHKSVPQQTELVNNLHDQIRQLDWEIISEEAKLGDFKRSSSKSWMMLKFGGLLECAEKATIIGELGRLVVDEIPLEETEPGKPRAYYNSHERVASLVQEAQRCVSEVVFRPPNMNLDLDRAISLSPEPAEPEKQREQQQPGSTVVSPASNEANPFANPPQAQSQVPAQPQIYPPAQQQPQVYEAYGNEEAYADDTAYEHGQELEQVQEEQVPQQQPQVYAPPPGLPPMPTGPPPQPQPQPQPQVAIPQPQVPQQTQSQVTTPSVNGNNLNTVSPQGIPESEVVYRERIGAEEGHGNGNGNGGGQGQGQVGVTAGA